MQRSRRGEKGGDDLGSPRSKLPQNLGRVPCLAWSQSVVVGACPSAIGLGPAQVSERRFEEVADEAEVPLVTSQRLCYIGKSPGERPQLDGAG